MGDSHRHPHLVVNSSKGSRTTKNCSDKTEVLLSGSFKYYRKHRLTSTLVTRKGGVNPKILKRDAVRDGWKWSGLLDSNRLVSKPGKGQHIIRERAASRARLQQCDAA